MCICFCCCNCCNSYSSKCIEFSILTLSSITFACSLLNIIIIKFNHLNIGSFILLILSVVFSFIMIFLSILIIIYRKNGTINKDKNSISICFVYIGLFISLIIFLISLVSESLIQAKFNEINHPCKEYNIQISASNNTIYFRILTNIANIRYLSDIITDKEAFCKDKEKSYNAKIISEYEYNISYFTASFIEFSCLILCFFWFNESKRLKKKIDGAIIINRIDLNEIGKRQSIYGGNINPIDNYLSRNNQNFNQSSDYQSQAILVNNKKNRRNTAFNLNFSRDSGRKNFISNLRKEIKNGMEIIEEDETKNKEIKENKDNINDNKMNNNKKRRNSNLRKIKIDDNNQGNNNLKNDNNINNNEFNNENKDNNDNKDNRDNNEFNNDNKDINDNNANNEDIIVKKNSKRKSRGSIINIKKRRKSKIRKSRVYDLDIYNSKNNELNKIDNMEKEKNDIKYIKEENDEDIIDPPDIIPPKE